MRISWPKFLILIVMSIIGIIASSIVFALYELLHTDLPICKSANLFLGIRVDCDAVLSSPYNNVAGFNLDILAIVYFIVSLGLVCVVAFGSAGLYTKAFKALFAWRFIGLLIVPYLMIIEFVILKTVCIYCTIMHVAILVDFGIVTYFFFYKKDVKTFLTSSTGMKKGMPQVGPQ
jgi:uncharacterized membrane protein